MEQAHERLLLDLLQVAFMRAKSARAEAAALLEAGFAGPSLVWSVRAAEILVRDFLVLPHFVAEGLTWERALKRAGRVLDNSDWANAFAKVDEWYGPFDEPLTEDDLNAWQVWKGPIVRRRGDVIHGRAVLDVTPEEARQVLAFAEHMATWFRQRFLTSSSHPIGIAFRQALEQLRDSQPGEQS